MNKDHIRYVGEWWVPAPANPDIQMLSFKPDEMLWGETKHDGVLTYNGENGIELEILKVPSKLPIKLYNNNPVMWGRTLNCELLTLFGAESKDMDIGDFTHIVYKVRYVIKGEHVLNPSEARYSLCEVKFPYLRNWAFKNYVSYTVKPNGVYQFGIDVRNLKEYLMEALVEESVEWKLRSEVNQRITRPFDLNITQRTDFLVQSEQGLSLRDCIRHIGLFRQFLSIALYCEQNPTEVILVNKDGKKSRMFFRIEPSEDPGMFSLIKFDVLKTNVPKMVQIWYNNFERVSPISSYLIQSLHRKNVFEVPDFLILAQALDGYHKRFINKIDGKNHKKYEDGIKALLKGLDDVECVKRCHIDPKVLKDSRDKYSHLLPDEENTMAVEGRDLLWLTKKCQVLLTCCLLDMMGLSHEEINICCNDSPITNMMEAEPFEFQSIN